MITLYGLGPACGLPDASPLVMRAAAQLSLAGLPFERADGADLVADDGAPVIVDGDLLVTGAAEVRAHVERRAGLDLDAGLGSRERAIAAVMTRMIEADLHPLAPGPPASAATLIPGGGAAAAERAVRVIEALEALLSADRYLLGDRPTAVDAAASAGLAVAVAAGGDVRARVEGSERLTRYLARTMRRFHRDHRPPATSVFACDGNGLAGGVVERATALMAHL